MKQETCQITEDNMNMTSQVVLKTTELRSPALQADIISEQILINLFVARIHKSLEVIARIDRMLTADVKSSWPSEVGWTYIPTKPCHFLLHS